MRILLKYIVKDSHIHFSLFTVALEEEITFLKEIPIEEKRILQDDMPPPFNLPSNYSYHVIKMTRDDFLLVQNAPKIIGQSILESIPFQNMTSTVIPAEFEDILTFCALRRQILPYFVFNYYYKRMTPPYPNTNTMLLYKTLRIISFHRMILYPHADIDVPTMWAIHREEARLKTNI